MTRNNPQQKKKQARLFLRGLLIASVAGFLFLFSKVVIDNSKYTNSADVISSFFALDELPEGGILVNGDGTPSSNLRNPNGATYFQDPMNPLAIPQGQAPNLPSIRVEDGALEKKRRKYGGQGDKQHLGGFSEMDPGGISIPTFKHMIEKLGVKSFLDIGCGRGFSTSWFVTHGVDAMCAEGSHDGILRTIIPESEKRLVEHDFSRGPWWPAKTYDAAWSVEFLEHVGLNYHANYVAAFRKAALIFVTASTNTGWHHVEVHTPNWWIRKYESYGFKYDDTLTQELRQIAKDGKKDYMAPNGVYLDGFYVRSKLMVFVNPMVASLPEHAHLFPETGCVHKPWGRHPCAIENGETPLPDSMLPLNLTQAMDDAWMNLIKENVEGMPK